MGIFSNGKKEWQKVFDARTAFFTANFGALPDDILKLGHMSGVWPGGGIYELPVPKIGPGLWLYTTFGLTNPDMPTTVTASNAQTEQEQGRTMRSSHTLEKKAKIPIYKGRPGYGYEMMMLADQHAQWPLWFMQWAVNAEILNDADFLGRVERYQGLTIEDIDVGDAGHISVLIAKAQAPLPESSDLPNGTMQLLIATVITDDEMTWSMENRRIDLLRELRKAGVGQVSKINRQSVLNPNSVDYSTINDRITAEELGSKGLLRKIYLFPLDFGGQELEANLVYAPRAAALQKQKIDRKIGALAQQGKINHYAARPEYTGKSFIPQKIVIEASGQVTVQETVRVWG